MGAGGVGAGTFGRRAELQALDAALGRLARHQGGVVVVEGEAGVGKSHLVAEAVARATAAGHRVLVGAGDELDLGRPFAPLVDACLDDPEVGADVAAALASGADRAFVADALGAVLERAAQQRPTVLAVEDCHWAGGETLYALAALQRRRAPILLVVSARPWPRPPELARVLARLEADGAVVLALAGLDGPAQEELVAALAGAPPSADLAQLAGSAAGNPLLLGQLLHALRAEGRLVVRDGRAEVDGVAVPATLRASVRSRLSGLPPSTAEALRAAAVLGRSFRPADVAGVLGRDGVAVVRDLEPAHSAGLLGDEGNHLAFRHDLIRVAVYEDTPAPFRVELHRAAAGAVRAGGGPLAVVAHHVARASEPGDPAAVALLVEAAEPLVSCAPGDAVELLERARLLAGEAGAAPAHVDARLALPLAWVGRVDEAVDRAERALAGGVGAADERAALLGLARARLMQGRAGDGHASLERLARTTGTPPAEAADLLAEAALVRLLGGDPAGAAGVAEEARRAGEACGNRAAVALALCTDALRANMTGRYQDALVLARTACEVAAGHGGHQPHYILALVQVDADHLDEVAATLAAGMAAKRREGTSWDRPLAHSLAAHAHFVTGAWDDALAELDVARDVADEGGSRVGMAWSTAVRSVVLLRRGDREAAADALAAAQAEVARSGPQFGAEWVLLAEALAAEADGDHARAAATAGLAWDVDRALGIVTELRALGPPLVRSALAAGDRGRAAAVASGLSEVASSTKLASDEGAALRCAGLVEGDAALLVRAVAVLRRSPRLLELAEAAEDASVLLALRGERAQASALAEEALEVYERAGAAHDAARTLARLRRAGLRRGARGARSRPSTGPASLTPTEVRVARLVREGLTNDEVAARLFVSRRTVETHLSHIFAKLGVGGRREIPPV